jgi:hypothetical protein
VDGRVGAGSQKVNPMIIPTGYIRCEKVLQDRLKLVERSFEDSPSQVLRVRVDVHFGCFKRGRGVVGQRHKMLKVRPAWSRRKPLSISRGPL